MARASERYTRPSRRRFFLHLAVSPTDDAVRDWGAAPVGGQL